MSSSKLFTPGPLTTSDEIKRSMLCDYGSRDEDFLRIVKTVRDKITSLACIKSHMNNEFTTVLMQGSGTFSVEATLNSCIPKRDIDNKLLVIVNGSYGKRMLTIAKKMGICAEILEFDETKCIDINMVEETLSADKNIKYVGMVHHETSTGNMNDVPSIGKMLRARNITFIVDSMSAFGAVDIDIYEDGIDFLVSSANKCIEGVPGFAYAICNKTKLLQSIHSTSVSLDLLDQWNNFEKTGQFRFTPPTHTIVAFNKAIADYEKEGGLNARIDKYKKHYSVLYNGMIKMGFVPFLPVNMQGYFITSFLYPKENFNFTSFYNHLKDNGLVIYPGKTTNIPSFRIGNIGNLYLSDIEKLLTTIDEYIVNHKKET